MSSWTTVIELTNDWLFLPDLVIATREANSQVPLPETTAVTIYYRSPVANGAAKIFRTNDPLSGAEGQILLPEEQWEDAGSPGNSRSLREWFVKGEAGGELLEVEMIN